MKRYLLVLAAATALTASAETLTRLNVWTVDDDQIVYEMNTAPRVSFEGGNLVITMYESQSSIPMDRVARFTYDTVDVPDLTGIDRLSTPSGSIIFSLRPGLNLVEVYTPTGELVMKDAITVADATERQLPLEGLAPGYYVVKVNDSSYKLLKK